MDRTGAEWFGYSSLIMLLLWALFWIAIWCSLWGSACALIAYAKRRSITSGYQWGFFLGPIGLSVVALQKPGVQPLPPAPAGYVAKQCVRCNAVHNVGVSADRFDCWRCDQGHKIKPAAGQPSP